MSRLLLLGALVLIPCFATAQSVVLTLKEFLQLVERQHPSLQSANYEPDLAEAEIRNALGRFDPVLSVDYDTKRKSGQDKFSLLDGSLELPLDMLFGPKLKADYRRGSGFQIDPENATSSAGEASVGIAMPVFQGIFTDTRRNTLRKALLRPDIAKAQFAIERNGLLRSAAIRYWDWCEATEQLAVADSLFKISLNRLDFVRRRAKAGETPSIDTIEALQETLRRQGERVRAERIEQQSYIDMSSFLWDARQPIRLSSYTCEPLTVTDDGLPIVDSSVYIARMLRPELQRASFMVETSRFDSSLAAEYMRPFVEVSAGLVSYDVSESGKLDYKLGLKVQQPLFFRQAAAQMQTSSIAVDRAELSMLLAQRLVEIDAQNAVIGLAKAYERLNLAEQEVDAANAMVEAEQVKFKAGDSSQIIVNLRERFLGEALQRLVSAKADVLRAKINLSWATGVI